MARLARLGVVALLMCAAACGSRDTPNRCSMVGSWSRPSGASDEIASYSFDGKFAISIDGNVGAAGSYDVLGNTFTVTGTDPDCPDAPVIGRYTIAFGTDCSTVTATLVKDDCADRAANLNGTTFTRQP